MPQLRKSGKLVYGWSEIRPGGTMRIPPQILTEYPLTADGKVILISGSKQTGGFSVSTRALLKTSMMKELFVAHPALDAFAALGGSFLPYKGRQYAWAAISGDGMLTLPSEALTSLSLCPGARLLAIRSSNIAVTFGQKGNLIESAREYKGEIPVY